MKTTKKLLSSLYIVGLLATSSAAFGATDAAVENTVKYGEKYLCDIQTTDGKNYSLELQWTTEPVSYSQFPKWANVLKYSLNGNGESIDGGYFSNLGFARSSLEFNFAWNNYSFVGWESLPTRVGTNHATIDIQIAKSYDKDAKTILSVASFLSTSERSYYRLYEPKKIELKIQNSLCSVAPVSKD